MTRKRLWGQEYLPRCLALDKEERVVVRMENEQVWVVDHAVLGSHSLKHRDLKLETEPFQLSH